MDSQPILRIITFSISAAIFTLQIMWMLIVLPKILRTNFGFAQEDVPLASAYFYNAHFAGMIVSCFLWPVLNRHLAKRTSLLLGLFTIFVFNTLMSIFTSFFWFCFFIFMVGVGSNSNSVGKDFIFEFALKPIYRQYALTIKSVFNIICISGGPFFGYMLYNYFNEDFTKVLLVISGIFAIVIVLFIFVFFVNYDLKNQLKLDSFAEEENPIVKEALQTPEEPRGMVQLFKECFSNSYLRALMLTYIITNAFAKSANVIIVIYAETCWEQQGLGLSIRAMSLISFFSIFPSILILLQAPFYVPKNIHYFTFIRTMILLMLITVISVPSFRDLFGKETVGNPLVYLILSFIFWSNPKSFSPFLNYLLNSEVKRHERTTLNASLFFIEIVGAMITMHCFALIYKLMLYSDITLKLGVFAKYVTFLLLASLLSIPVLLLKKKIFNPTKKQQITI